MSWSAHMKGQFWFFPHGHINAWAAHLFDDAKSVSAGSANYYRISAVLAVMSFEAYLNYIGERRFEDWKEKLPWSKKLDRILNEFGLIPLRHEEPLSLLDELFEYRNTLAHGKIATKLLNYVDHEDGRVEGEHRGDPQWYEEFGNREQADRTLKAIRDSMLVIHKIAEPNDARLPWKIFGEGHSSEVTD